jgi:hypothetical protein
MIIEEKVNKHEGGISRRANELGLRLADIEILDWTPMYAIMLYDQESVGKTVSSRERPDGEPPPQTPQTKKGAV